MPGRFVSRAGGMQARLLSAVSHACEAATDDEKMQRDSRREKRKKLFLRKAFCGVFRLAVRRARPFFFVLRKKGIDILKAGAIILLTNIS